MSGDRLAIAQVTPFAWEVGSEVNEYIARVSDELARRGHRVLIIAPSESSSLVRDSRRAIREQRRGAARNRHDGAAGRARVSARCCRSRRRAGAPRRCRSTSRARSRRRLSTLPLDIVNVHEPFAPSASSVALRHSRALNVGSFHAPTERILSTQLTRPLTQLLFSRLDARTASYAATRNLLQRYFPGDYRVITPGADPQPPREPGAATGAGHDRD